VSRISQHLFCASHRAHPDPSVRPLSTPSGGRFRRSATPAVHSRCVGKPRFILSTKTVDKHTRYDRPAPTCKDLMGEIHYEAIDYKMIDAEAITSSTQWAGVTW
jgi:hypothetical protein